MGLFCERLRAVVSTLTLPLAMGLLGELIEFSVIALVLGVLIYWISRAMPTKIDRDWLPSLVMWGFSAKVVGAFLRYVMAIDLYGTGG